MGNWCNCCGPRRRARPEPTSIPRPPKPIIVVGIHSFRANHLQDLSFNKGDRMKVLNDCDDQWLLVEHLSTMRHGKVPANFVALESSLESYDWFFNKISRKEAEILLLGDEEQPGGTYLIRPSENDTRYALSVKDYEPDQGWHVKHWKIKQTNEGRFYILKPLDFKNLQDLVAAHSRRSDSDMNLLSVACKKPQPVIIDFNSTYRDNWEIERAEIEILQLLGSGNFGQVYRGKWKGQYEVAIKTLRSGATSKEEFLKEAGNMKRLRHNKLVRLYGVCTLNEPLFIVQEFMENGSLQMYLREDRGRTVKLEDLVFIAFQVASGMEHLEINHYVHRDLAARNVLLGPNNLAKICDFGLARIVNNEDNSENGRELLPVKWTAPEALVKGIFTTKSDVWSYGVLLMEIFTYGETPYKGVSQIDAVTSVLAGSRMPKPKDYILPDEIYATMLKCWDINPQKRPSFKFLSKYFESMGITYQNYGQGKRKIVITHNAPKSYSAHELRRLSRIY